MNAFYKILFWAQNFFFPQVCVLCGENLNSADEIRYSLCADCCLSLSGKRTNGQLPEMSLCGMCGRPLISEMNFCLPCRNGKERAYDRLWVLFPYTGMYRRLLAAYKFHKTPGLANFLAEKIPGIIGGNPELKDAVIVPVPPRPGKIKQTGWDQIDCLVKKLKKTDRGLTVSRCLKRKKSRVQKKLDRSERILNMRGSIFAHKAAPLTALIIDDVITTGSTMEACAAALKEAGTQKVYGLCLFYD